MHGDGGRSAGSVGVGVDSERIGARRSPCRQHALNYGGASPDIHSHRNKNLEI